MKNNFEIRFHSPFSGAVDAVAGVIRGVALMTGNLVAEGHDLEVDETTLRQVLSCAKQTGKIPVKLDHGSGISSLCGYIDGATATLDGNKVRGDWHLLKTHEQFATLVERAQMMPECFGMSAAFKGGGEAMKVPGKIGKKAARCERLLAVDCVTQPAANPTGLFSARVDSGRRGMPEDNQTDPNSQAPAWAQQILEQLGTLNTKMAGFEQFQHDVTGALHEPTLDELAQMDDVQLAEWGVTREQVDTAIAQAEAGGDLEHQPGTEGTPEGGAPGIGAGGGGGAATALSAGDRALNEIILLKAGMARREQAEEQAHIDHAFSVVEQKVTALSTLNDTLTKRNGELEAEVKALKLFNKTGGNRPAPGAEGVTLFHGKGAVAGSFEALVAAKITEFKTANPKLAEASARSQAVQFCIRTHTDAYADYRHRGGRIEFGK